MAALEYYRQIPHDWIAFSPMWMITAPTLVLCGELDLQFGVGLPDRLAQPEPKRMNAALLAFLSVRLAKWQASIRLQGENLLDSEMYYGFGTSGDMPDVWAKSDRKDGVMSRPSVLPMCRN